VSVFALIICLVLFVPSAFGQTVSILNGGKDPASKAVEAAIVQTLRAQGYTVKAGSTDGFVLLLKVLKVQTRDGASAGLAGSLTMVSVQGDQFEDVVLSRECQAEHPVAQRLQHSLGTRLTQNDSTIAFAPTIEVLADLLSGFSHHTVRAAAQKVDVLAHEAQKVNGPQLNPSPGHP
jgi:hypothetical protein